jgi:hypothetical protein
MNPIERFLLALLIVVIIGWVFVNNNKRDKKDKK